MNAAPALAPDHREDLHRSGLRDDVIAALQFESLNPHALRKFSTVNSAYRIPYFAIDGSKNCFERWKLFPPITGPDGSSQKYYQAAGSHPQLYLHPWIDWPAIVTDPQAPIIITEGEKKTAALIQAKKCAAVGVAGVWNWCLKVDGDRLVIPTLDLFVWTGRVVTLLPDSDVWRPNKEQALRGFYALGMELIGRGARVHFLKLPESDGVKIGIDDWLIHEGTGWETSWPHLETVTLDDARLVTFAAWYQNWEAKQTEQDARKKRELDGIEITETAGGYKVRLPQHAVTLTFYRLTEARGSTNAELTATLGATELYPARHINLTSTSSQTQHIKELREHTTQIPWKQLLQKACSLVLTQHRHGEPIIELSPAIAAHIPFVLNPLVYSLFQSLIFAPGGSCKSYLALWLAMLVCHGARWAGVAGVKTPVLYLDWELNADALGVRLKELQTGHPELSHVRPYYRRCESPLHQEAHTIAAFVKAHNIGFLVIDSAAMACGGELSSPEAAITLQRALRKINCAALVLAHTAKSVQEGQAPTAYGTVFFRELARNVFELSKADDENPVHLILSHIKYNFGPKQSPLGYSLTFSEGSVRVDAYDVAAEPAFQNKLPLVNRIRNLLDDGRPRTSKEIADELDAKHASVKVLLSRYCGMKWVKLGDNRDALWTVLNR